MSNDDDKVVQLEAVRDVLEGAAEPPVEAPGADVTGEKRPAPPASRPRGDGRIDSAGPDLVVPPDCPVRPLGLMGDVYFLLDANDQLREVKDRDFSVNKINSLFGREGDWLWEHAPFSWQKRMADPPHSVEKVKAAVIAQAMMYSCSQRGVLDVFGRVRGRGGWRDPSGALVFHLGNHLAISRKPLDPVAMGEGALEPMGFDVVPTGTVADYVYPSRPPLPRPAEAASETGARGAGEQLLGLLQSWHWRRELDPLLLLGWIGCAFLGGALVWRPLAWITGDRGTGKSTLHEVIKGVMGTALLAVTDATAAGIWQKLGYDCLAVAFDELENDANDNRKGERVIAFARTASSGGMVLRGGQDHNGSDFEARSCFLFSSINMMSLQPQDKSRMAILELLPLTRGAPPPVLDGTELAAWGAAIRRRLLDQWPRFPATLQRYREALQRAGHSARGADQFGALLAAQDLLLANSSPDSDTADELAGALAAATLSELSDERSNHQACLDHALSWLDPVDKSGERLTIGKALERAVGLPDDREGAQLDIPTMKRWRSRLTTYGMKLRYFRADDVGLERGDQWVLLVANHGSHIQTVFDRSQWQAAAGGSGPWRDALKRLDGAWVCDKAQRFGAVSAKSIALPLPLVIDADDLAWLRDRQADVVNRDD